MNGVWCLLKLLQSFMGLVCIGLLIFGFFKVRSFEVTDGLHCILIYAMTMIAINGVISIMSLQVTNLMCQFVANMIATVLYIFVSLDIMYHAENNYYLLLLSIYTEPLKPFFLYCKWLSMATLICAILHLINTCLVADYLFGKSELMFLTGSVVATRVPFKLYTGGKTVHEYFNKFQWFQEFEKPRVKTKLI